MGVVLLRTVRRGQAGSSGLSVGKGEERCLSQTLTVNLLKGISTVC